MKSHNAYNMLRIISGFGIIVCLLGLLMGLFILFTDKADVTMVYISFIVLVSCIISWKICSKALKTIDRPQARRIETFLMPVGVLLLGLTMLGVAGCYLGCVPSWLGIMSISTSWIWLAMAGIGYARMLARKEKEVVTE